MTVPRFAVPVLFAFVAAELTVAVAALAGGVGGSGAGLDRGAAAVPVTSSTSTTSVPAVVEAPAPPHLVVLASGDPLDPALESGLAPLAPVVTARVRRGRLGLTVTRQAGAEVDRAPEGMEYPLESIALDPAAFRPVVAPEVRSTIDALAPGTALLGASSAALRRLGPGAELVLDDGSVRPVLGVLPDEVVGWAEVVVHAADPVAASFEAGEYLVAGFEVEPPPPVDVTVSTALGDPPGVAVLTAAEAGGLRPTTAVPPQVVIKQRFGEFAFTEGTGRDFAAIDPVWAKANIVSGELPILGRVECHRLVYPIVRALLTELEQTGQADLLDPATYGGCWVPRLITGGHAVSRHAWGIAIDVNVGGARGWPPPLVDAFARYGFTWGGSWVTPDRHHFEYVVAPPS